MASLRLYVISLIGLIGVLYAAGGLQAVALSIVAAFVLLVCLLILGAIINSNRKYPNQTAHAKPSSTHIASFLNSSACHLASLIRQRKLTSREAVLAFSDNIIRVNAKLNAVCSTRFPEALQEAEAADQRISEIYAEAGSDADKLKRLLDELPPFHGVPCSVKECFSFPGMSWSSGLLSRTGKVAEIEATAIARMRAGGFIPLANTNTSELCMWYESHNPVFGRTNNPYDLSRMVGGSSGGEAALIAACGAPSGLGSDIGGSIRMPAFFNGVFGHKATGGVVPGTGQHPIAVGAALRYLTTGPIAKHACDLWPMFRLMAGPDGIDSGCTDISATFQHDPATIDVTTIEIAYVENLDGLFPFFVTPLHPEMRQAYDRCAEHLKQRGCKVRGVTLKGFKKAADIWSAMLADAGGPTFKELLEDSGPLINLPVELIKWSFGQSEYTLPALMLALVEYVPKMFPAKATEMVQEGILLRKRMTEDVLGDNTVLLFPSHPTTAPRHGVPLLRPANFIYTAIFNTMETPVTQVPLGLDSEGLPLGIQLVAPHHHDHLSIAVALELEKAFGGWVPPPILTIDK